MQQIKSVNKGLEKHTGEAVNKRSMLLEIRVGGKNTLRRW